MPVGPPPRARRQGRPPWSGPHHPGRRRGSGRWPAGDERRASRPRRSPPSRSGSAAAQGRAQPGRRHRGRTSQGRTITGSTSPLRVWTPRPRAAHLTSAPAPPSSSRGSRGDTVDPEASGFAIVLYPCARRLLGRGPRRRAREVTGLRRLRVEGGHPLRVRPGVQVLDPVPDPVGLVARLGALTHGVLAGVLPGHRERVRGSADDHEVDRVGERRRGLPPTSSTAMWTPSPSATACATLAVLPNIDS